MAQWSDEDDRLVVWLSAGAVRDQRRASRLLLDRALAEWGSPLRSATHLAAEPSGRPVLRAAGAPRVSISHTLGMTAVALARAGDVGVDVESLRAVPAEPLARRWFLAEEARWLAERPEPERPLAFLWLWTQKEAMGKVRGIGLRHGCTRLAVPGLGRRPLPGAAADLVAAGGGVWVTDLPGPATHVVAAAATGCRPVELRQVPADRLG